MPERNIGNEIESNLNDENKHNGRDDNDFIVPYGQYEESEGSRCANSNWNR